MNRKNKLVEVEKKKNIGIIILNRPEVMNALNTPMLLELSEALSELEKDRNIRAIIVRGGRHFCAGADIRELTDKKPEDARDFSRLGQGLCNRISHLGKPVIAAVSGYALGGGCEISLACDIRIAGENARFGQPEANIGIIPGWGATQRLPGLIGVGKAKEIIMMGKIINAVEALALGLVSRVAKDGELFEKAEEDAGIMAGKSQPAIRRIKNLIDARLGVDKGLDFEAGLFSECFDTDDYKEGIKAFLEKRKPAFKEV
ncbi:MAG TPA: enoyl-CoA hydratase-related protein [Dissulfurispiraceae bacterium]|nr:enoyl-CoA hydratase-related protein [Dissulfurispiraceae bacterium]